MNILIPSCAICLDKSKKRNEIVYPSHRHGTMIFHLIALTVAVSGFADGAPAIPVELKSGGITIKEYDGWKLVEGAKIVLASFVNRVELAWKHDNNVPYFEVTGRRDCVARCDKHKLCQAVTYCENTRPRRCYGFAVIRIPKKANEGGFVQQSGCKYIILK